MLMNCRGSRGDLTSSEGFASIHRQAGRQKKAADKIIDLEGKAPARSARTHGPSRRWHPGMQAIVKSSIRKKSQAIKNCGKIFRHRTSPTRRAGTRQVLAFRCASKVQPRRCNTSIGKPRSQPTLFNPLISTLPCASACGRLARISLVAKRSRPERRA